MAKMPTAQDIGIRTASPNNNAPVIDRRVIDMPARALEAQGTELQKIGVEANEADDKLDMAKAKSLFLQKNVQALNSFENDPDYSSYGKKYNDMMADAQQQASGLIKNPLARETFSQDMAGEVARGAENVAMQSRKKEADIGVASMEQGLIDNNKAILAAPDEETRAGLITSSNAMIDGAIGKGYITAAHGTLLKQKTAEDIATTTVNMLPPDQRLQKLQDLDNGMVKMIPADVNLRMRTQAENEMRRDQADYRADLKGKIKDDLSMAYDGAKNPNPLTIDDFRKAYGEDAPAEYKAHQDDLQYANSYYNLATQTPDEQSKTLASMAPVPGEGYADQSKKYELASKAVDEINKSRQNDPMAFAIGNNLTDVSQLDMGNPQQLSQQIARRAGVAETMHEDYGSPVQVFTKSEASNISNTLNNMSATQKVEYLKSMRDGISDNDTYRSAMQQIRPGSPITALAGGYLSMDSNIVENHWFGKDTVVTPSTVADRLIKGEALINPTEQDKKSGIKPVDLPPKEQFQDAFNSYVKSSFQNYPVSEQYALDASKAYYAALVAETGGVDNNKLDNTKYQQALKESLGTVADHNGDILLPWGMNEDSFDNAAKPALQRALQRNGINPDNFKYSSVGFQNSDTMGRYVVTNGSGPLLNKNGLPIIMDLNDANTAGE